MITLDALTTTLGALAAVFAAVLEVALEITVPPTPICNLPIELAEPVASIVSVAVSDVVVHAVLATVSGVGSGFCAEGTVMFIEVLSVRP